MDVQIDRNKCEGTAMCLAAARGWFALDGEMKAVFQAAANGNPQAIQRAVRMCPTGAIAVVNSDDGAG